MRFRIEAGSRQHLENDSLVQNKEAFELQQNPFPLIHTHIYILAKIRNHQARSKWAESHVVMCVKPVAALLENSVLKCVHLTYSHRKKIFICGSYIMYDLDLTEGVSSENQCTIVLLL